MKNYKSVLSFVLAIMMVLTTMSPLGNIAKADSEKDRFLLEVSDLKSDVKTAVASLQTKTKKTFLTSITKQQTALTGNSK